MASNQADNISPSFSFSIMTVAIGADYRKALQAGLNSKRTYATIHRYPYIEIHDEIYEHERPPAWYKIKAIINYLTDPNIIKTDWLFVSDADVIITNYNKPLSEIITLSTKGDIIWSLDACGHLNSGNMFIRTSSSHVVAFLNRVWNYTLFIYHPWWENAAMVHLYLTDPSVREFIITDINSSKFNAYLTSVSPEVVEQNITDLIRDDISLLHFHAARTTIYSPGDLLIHFAGIYNTSIIKRMMEHIALTGNVDRQMFLSWLPQETIIKKPTPATA